MMVTAVIEWSDPRYALARDGAHLAFQEAGIGPDFLPSWKDSSRST